MKRITTANSFEPAQTANSQKQHTIFINQNLSQTNNNQSTQTISHKTDLASQSRFQIKRHASLQTLSNPTTTVANWNNIKDDPAVVAVASNGPNPIQQSSNTQPNANHNGSEPVSESHLRIQINSNGPHKSQKSFPTSQSSRIQKKVVLFLSLIFVVVVVVYNLGLLIHFLEILMKESEVEGSIGFKS